MSARVEDGEYIARIKEAGFKIIKQREMAYVNLSVPFGNETLALTWWGSLTTEKSRTFVLNTFKKINPGIKSWDDIGSGMTLEPDTEVKAVLENKMNENTGIAFLAVKFINPTKMTVNPKFLSFLNKQEEEKDLPF